MSLYQHNTETNKKLRLIQETNGINLRDLPFVSVIIIEPWWTGKIRRQMSQGIFKKINWIVLRRNKKHSTWKEEGGKREQEQSEKKTLYGSEHITTRDLSWLALSICEYHDPPCTRQYSCILRPYLITWFWIFFGPNPIILQIIWWRH